MKAFPAISGGRRQRNALRTRGGEGDNMLPLGIGGERERLVLALLDGEGSRVRPAALPVLLLAVRLIHALLAVGAV